MLHQDELYTQKVELLLEQQNKRLMGALDGIRQELQELKDQVAGIRRMQASSPAASQPSATAATAAMPLPSAPAAQPVQATRSDKPIDRNGVAPSDVSIEKMFYFGQK